MRRLNMNRTLQLSVLMALAIPVMVAAAEAEEGMGSSGCTTQQHTGQAATGCDGPTPAEGLNEKEPVTPCGMPEVVGSEYREAAARSAMMDGRPGGWPHRHDKRPLGAKKPGAANQADALKHGGCS
jgi:hypothetical protein